MITTTLNRIQEYGTCHESWRKLLAGLGKTTADSEPLSFAKIVEINGIDDALCVCSVEPQYAKEWRLFAVWCARQVEHLMEDERSKRACDVAERHANGDASNEELADAWSAARSAAAEMASEPVWGAAAWAAVAARDAAWETAWDATRASVAARAATAANDSSWDAARDAQTLKFMMIVNEDRNPMEA